MVWHRVITLSRNYVITVNFQAPHSGGEKNEKFLAQYAD